MLYQGHEACSTQFCELATKLRRGSLVWKLLEAISDTCSCETDGQVLCWKSDAAAAGGSPLYAGEAGTFKAKKSTTPQPHPRAFDMAYPCMWDRFTRQRFPLTPSML